MNPRLSICIATLNRGSYIGATLESIVPQLDESAEVVIVDGASTDNTAEVVASFCRKFPQVRYFREPVNSGADQDYDKSVGYARGDYCWLMTDDDLLRDGAVGRVLAQIGDVDLVVVNAEVRNKDLSSVLDSRLLPVKRDKHFDGTDPERVFTEVAGYLSFIGGVVVRREWWQQRRRQPYYGSLFVHIGVLFQAPAVSRVRVIADPLLTIRFGNAKWTSRGFEIWMFMWPGLIWTFDHFSAHARAAVCAPQPFRSPRRLLWYRAIGGYSPAEYRRFLVSQGTRSSRLAASFIAWLPARFANFCCALYYMLRCEGAAHLGLYELSRSGHASRLAKRVAALRNVS
jgi:glycosyltransferase involved in cell wall biosynthesis